MLAHVIICVRFSADGRAFVCAKCVSIDAVAPLTGCFSPKVKGESVLTLLPYPRQSA